jgi:hypothetical protein
MAFKELSTKCSLMWREADEQLPCLQGWCSVIFCSGTKFDLTGHSYTIQRLSFARLSHSHKN